MEQAPAFRRVHVVINPASGKDQPILNTLNDVFHQYGGDGTQHELANAVIGTATPMAVLPGGTGLARGA